MSPVIESISLLAESARLLVELTKIIRAAIAQVFSKDGFRTLSSLTTIEFRYEDGKQIAHYVQDRQIVFTREAVLPSFRYATAGQDFIDEVLIDSMPAPFRTIDKTATGPAEISPEEPTRYQKNYQINAVLLARSINGYINAHETQSIRVVRWVGRTSVAIVFPAAKKPKFFGVSYRGSKDSEGTKRHLGYQACTLKKTTFDRWVLLFELNNMEPKRTYTLEWTWPG